MIVVDDFSELVIQKSETIRTAIERINATPHLIQIVVDSHGRAVGMVTDGDVRRALVAGETLESPVTKCMHPDPILAPDNVAAAQILSDQTNRWRCVPVADDSGRIIRIVSDVLEASGIELAVIMAGGFGKRLGEKTRNKPKPLLEVAGRPIIWHLVKNLEANGIKRAFITLHYLGEQIRSFLTDSDFKIELNFIEESEPLGTAGGLGFLPPSVDGPILILNSDIVTRVDFRAMMVHHQLHHWDATVAAIQYESEIPFGVLESDDNGLIMAIKEKPRSTSHVSAGIYLFEPNVYRIAAAGIPLDMPDLLGQAIAAKLQVGLFPIHEYWMDVGRPDDIQQAEIDLKQGKGAI
jgi:dTDP-glucose pyrophosphorylase